MGRSDDALAAARDAVTLYRNLSATSLDSFTPELAASLGALGAILLSFKREKDAVSAFAEGLRIIAPMSKKKPHAVAALLAGLAGDYVRAAEMAGVDPDDGLLMPIVETINSLNHEQEP